MVSSCERVSAIQKVDLLTCTYSNENLHAAVHDLDVLVVHEAAHDSDVGVGLGGAHSRGLRYLSPHAAGTVFAPPRVMSRYVKRQKVTLLEERKCINLCVMYAFLFMVHTHRGI